MGKFGLLPILVVTAVACVACKRPETAAHQPPAHAQPAAAAEGSAVARENVPAVKAPGEAKLGDRTTCAVHTSPAFAVTATTPKAEHDGRTYYFCCNHCAQRFLERPGDYVK